MRRQRRGDEHTPATAPAWAERMDRISDRLHKTRGGWLEHDYCRCPDRRARRVVQEQKRARRSGVPPDYPM